jgi:hypothetical protein
VKEIDRKIKRNFISKYNYFELIDDINANSHPIFLNILMMYNPIVTILILIKQHQMAPNLKRHNIIQLKFGQLIIPLKILILQLNLKHNLI